MGAVPCGAAYLGPTAMYIPCVYPPPFPCSFVLRSQLHAIIMAAYDNFMLLYFFMFGATAGINFDFFWGPESIVMPPYTLAKLDPVGLFMARTLGVAFAVIAASYAFCDVSALSFRKMTLVFHIATLPIFLSHAMAGAPNFSDWVWYVQSAISAAVAFWVFVLVRQGEQDEGADYKPLA